MCEMCGKAGELVTADVEGVELQVCRGCSKYGTVRRRTLSDEGRFSRPAVSMREESEFKVVGNFSSLLRESRERRKMTQEEFAKFLQERESIVAKWENGTVKPFVDVARRLEKLLGVKLVEKDEVAEIKIERAGRSDELTLGDFMKVRKRN